MDLVDQINQHTYLFLAEIGEPNDNVLRLVIEEARASDLVEDLVIGDVTIPDTRAIISDDRCFAYEIIFGSYVSYSVRNESYTPEDKSEEFTGRLFRSYTKSRFRDYVSVATFATDDYPGKLIHYEVVVRTTQLISSLSKSQKSVSYAAPNKSLQRTRLSAAFIKNSTKVE